MIFLAQEAAATAQETASHFPAWIPGWGASIILGVGWLVEHLKKVGEHRKLHNEIHKLREETLKLKEETIKLAGETLSSRQEARTQYDQSNALTSRLAEELSSLLVANPDKSLVDQARLVLCSAILESAIPNYLRFCEWEHLRRKSDSARLRDFLTQSVVHQMPRFAEWLEIVNLQNILGWLARNPALVDKEILRPFLDLAEELNKEDKDFVLPILRQEMDRMIASGRADDVA